MTRDARLSILSVQEVGDLYDLPRFTEEDRHLHFDLSGTERDLVVGVATISVAVHLVLQLGYFKAKRQFFVYGLATVSGDLEHILRQHFPGRLRSQINPISKPTRLEQQRSILKLFDYRMCDALAKKELEEKARRVAMLSAQPVFILQEVLQYGSVALTRRAAAWLAAYSIMPRQKRCRTACLRNELRLGPAAYK